MTNAQFEILQSLAKQKRLNPACPDRTTEGKDWSGAAIRALADRKYIKYYRLALTRTNYASLTDEGLAAYSAECKRRHVTNLYTLETNEFSTAREVTLLNNADSRLAEARGLIEKLKTVPRIYRAAVVEKMLNEIAIAVDSLIEYRNEPHPTNVKENA